MPSMPNNRFRSPAQRARLLVILSALLLPLVGAACKPPPWRANKVYQAHSSATFGAHHEIVYEYNGTRVRVVKNSCGADNWYSSLRYTGTCTAEFKNGRLEVRWRWNWVKGSPPIARTQSYDCSFNVAPNGAITRLKPSTLMVACNRFDP